MFLTPYSFGILLIYKQCAIFCPTNYVLSTAQLMTQVMCDRPIPLAARSKVWVCDCSLAEIAGSNPTAAWVSVPCRCCVLPGRGLCDGLITRPEEFYRVCVCVCVCVGVIVKPRQ